MGNPLNLPTEQKELKDKHRHCIKKWQKLLMNCICH